MSTECKSNQQFCLRWHNHQTSLMTSLPLLLNQNSLTDVTISAEGKTLQAHRVVLGACSNFFAELFSNFEQSYHPVIILPGAKFEIVNALISFIYSGETNVFEENISGLLLLAESLGVKGLSDFRQDNSKAQHETLNILNANENSNMFMFKEKTVTQHNIIPDENIPEGHLCKSKVLSLEKSYLQHWNTIKEQPENNSTIYDRLCADDEKLKSENDENSFKEKNFTESFYKISNILKCFSSPNTLAFNKDVNQNKLVFNHPSSFFIKQVEENKIVNTDKEKTITISKELKSDEQIDNSYFNIKSTLEPNVMKPFLSSKSYATCFICKKQLSNQYNLRVHLETHQNIKYSCNICSHISRSKDALRKHVSYRHANNLNFEMIQQKKKRNKFIRKLSAPIRPTNIKCEKTIDNQQKGIKEESLFEISSTNNNFENQGKLIL